MSHDDVTSMTSPGCLGAVEDREVPASAAAAAGPRWGDNGPPIWNFRMQVSHVWKVSLLCLTMKGEPAGNQTSSSST